MVLDHFSLFPTSASTQGFPNSSKEWRGKGIFFTTQWEPEDFDQSNIFQS